MGPGQAMTLTVAQGDCCSCGWEYGYLDADASDNKGTEGSREVPDIIWPEWARLKPD